MLREGEGEWLYGDEWKIKIMVMANKNTINIITRKILIMYLNLNSSIFIYPESPLLPPPARHTHGCSLEVLNDAHFRTLEDWRAIPSLR